MKYKITIFILILALIVVASFKIVKAAISIISQYQELRISDDDESNYIALQSVTELADNYTFVLPADDGDSGQVLHTDGSGNLTWDTDDGGSGTFAWTDTGYGVSTTSIPGFINGMMSMASSTFLSDLRVKGNLYASTTLTDAFSVAGTANNTSTIAENLVVSGNASTTELYIGGGLIKFSNGMCVGEDSATTTPNITIQSCGDF